MNLSDETYDIFFHSFKFEHHAIVEWEESQNKLYQDIYLVNYYFFINNSIRLTVRLIQPVYCTSIDRNKR